MSSSLTWTLASDASSFEVSSADHLLQIMSLGTLFTDTGDSPPDYLSPSFVQTVDINLASFSSQIIPIGTDAAPFTGTYNGSGFRVANWSYTGTLTDSGLFGYCFGATLKNITLSGVWDLNTTLRGGFLVSYMLGTADTDRDAYIYNISAEFESGTSLVSTGTQVRCATLIAFARFSVIQGISLSGVISVCSSAGHIAGVISEPNYCDIYMVRNIATFETPLIGRGVGGVVNKMIYCNASYIMNAMVGDIETNNILYSTAGVVMECWGLSSNVIDVFVNSMTGNIQEGGSVGGVVAYLKGAGPMSRFANYMNGYTEYAITDRLVSGSIDNCIVATSGSVENISATVYKDTSFGMTVTGNDLSTNSPPTGWTIHPDFPDLPYVPFSGTDVGGNTYNWEFVFPNVSGKAQYSAYTELTISSGPVISVPLRLEVDLPVNGTTFYVSYFDTSTSTAFIDPSLTVVDSEAALVYDLTGTYQKFPAPISVTTYTHLADVVWFAVESASIYQLKQDGVVLKTVQATVESEFAAIVQGLTPETTYVFDLYTDLDGFVTPARTVSGTTPALSAFNVGLLLGRISNDLTLLNSTAFEDVTSSGPYLRDALTTGDVVNTNLGKLEFVADAGQIDLNREEAPPARFLTAFDPNSGAGQSLNLLLPDGVTTSVMTYNESQNQVVLNSESRGVGEYFVVDSFKVSVREV